jgi:hypothetical protein
LSRSESPVHANSRETLSEINQISSSLENAVSHDIASNGQSVAEILDTNLGGSDAQDVMKLLLVASLSSVAGGTKGLTLPEIIANLCAPGHDISKLKGEVLDRLVTTAWYLHTGRDGRLFIKNVQNLVARLRTTAESYLHDQSIKDLRDRLTELFKPETGWCYQRVQALPAVDEKRSKAKADLQGIWMAATRTEATDAYERFLKRYGAKYPKATEKLEKDREALLAFFDFPADHWVHLRTTNPIESTQRPRAPSHQPH